jgi:hypothetical protein
LWDSSRLNLDASSAILRSCSYSRDSIREAISSA